VPSLQRGKRAELARVLDPILPSQFDYHCPPIAISPPTVCRCAALLGLGPLNDEAVPGQLPNLRRDDDRPESIGCPHNREADRN
jgi:hypothetical protein